MVIDRRVVRSEGGPGPALGFPHSHAFRFHALHASHALLCAPIRLPIPLMGRRDRPDASRLASTCTAAGAMRQEALGGPNRGRGTCPDQQCASPIAYSQPAAPGCALLCVLGTNRPRRHVQRSLTARGRRRQEAGAVSDHLRRHAGRWVVWAHGKAVGMGWRARFERAYHRRGRRGCSGRHLELHLLTLHSTRRRAPREATLFLTSSSSASSF